MWLDPSVHFVLCTHQELRPWDTWYMKTEYLQKQKELGIVVVVQLSYFFGIFLLFLVCCTQKIPTKRRGEGFLRIAVVLDRSGPLSTHHPRKSTLLNCNFEEGLKSVWSRALVPLWSNLYEFHWNPIMQRRASWSPASLRSGQTRLECDFNQRMENI